MCYNRPMVYAHVPNFVSTGLFCRHLAAKNPKFCRFFSTSAFCRVANWQQSEKVEHGAQLQTFPYLMVFLYSNAFMAKSGAQSLTFNSVTDKQTNRQTNKKIERLRLPRQQVSPRPTKHGMMIEDLKHFLAPRKLLGVRRTVSPLGGAKNLGKPDPFNLKPHNSVTPSKIHPNFTS